MRDREGEKIRAFGSDHQDQEPESGSWKIHENFCWFFRKFDYKFLNKRYKG